MRGKPSAIGDTRISPNGYHYTRTAQGWQLTHRVMAEELLGRELLPNERIRFKDGNRNNLKKSNIEVYETKTRSKERRKAQLKARLADIQAELEELDNEEVG